MSKKMYLGVAALIILLIGAGGFIYWQWSEVQQLKDKYAQDLEENDKPHVQHAVSRSKTKPPDEPGFVWVRHGDHWDKVPIARTPIAAPGAVQPKPHTTDAAGEVIYPHHELLQTHPVAALRAQARDTGHWSAKYIPPFPPDDVEANEYARNVYIRNYYKSVGDPYSPIVYKFSQAIMQLRIDSGIYVKSNKGSVRLNLHPSPRQMDLMRLEWTDDDSPPFDEATTWFGADMIHWVMDSTFTGEEYENANNQ